jgi:hypothetical protein
MRKPLELVGKPFGRLIAIERAPKPLISIDKGSDAWWKCSCSCGNITVVKACKLKRGHTLSCGCLKREAPHLPFLPQSQPIYSLEEVTMRGAWQTRYTDLPFSYFRRISQELCVYCGAEPCLTHTITRKDGSYDFHYNTLDRIDSSKGYSINNVVPACYTCNIGKRERHVNDFCDHIDRLIIHLDNRMSPEQCRIDIFSTNSSFNVICNSLSSSVKSTFHDVYNDGDLTTEQFYQLATSNCYYCRAVPTNKRISYLNKQDRKDGYSDIFTYNGLDRIDSNFTHNLNNVVPCCKWCNYAKSNLTLQQFNEWIMRLQSHRPYRHVTIFSANSPICLTSSSSGAGCSKVCSDFSLADSIWETALR